MEYSYVVITPVRNEEKYIERTIQSVIHQTIKPRKWIIVNDGSDDGTTEIISKYLTNYSWVELINRPNRGHRAGAGPAAAFNAGLAHVNCEYNFLVNLDGDVSFDANYFEKILIKFEENDQLGIASGRCYYMVGGKKVLYRNLSTSTMGPLKTYRKQCFLDIGECLFEDITWDTVDDIKAQMNGWQTASFNDISFIHYKIIGIRQGNKLKMLYKSGGILYSLGYHPLYIIAKGIYRSIEAPFIIGSLMLIAGYFLAYIKRNEIRVDKSIFEFLRKQQLKKIFQPWK